MTAHKNRAGLLLTSYSCKQGEHGDACALFLAEADDVIACHCGCHPDDGCQPTARRAPRRRARACPECRQVMPLTGTCETCPEPAPLTA